MAAYSSNCVINQSEFCGRSDQRIDPVRVLIAGALSPPPFLSFSRFPQPPPFPLTGPSPPPAPATQASSSSTAVSSDPPGQDIGSFCRYRKALQFWSFGISLYLELFCFRSFISFVLRNLYSGTHKRNQNMPYVTDVTLAQS